MPQKHEGSKFHEGLNICTKFLVELGALANWWQKNRNKQFPYMI